MRLNYGPRLTHIVAAVAPLRHTRPAERGPHGTDL